MYLAVDMAAKSLRPKVSIVAADDPDPASMKANNVTIAAHANRIATILTKQGRGRDNPGQAIHTENSKGKALQAGNDSLNIPGTGRLKPELLPGDALSLISR